MSDSTRPLRLLSLDGGGVRGLSSIMILRHLMERVNADRPDDQRLEPSDVFDMIGGTSTGGIIPIMLGRLRMTIDECEDAYLTLSKNIFTPRRGTWNKLGKGLDFLEAQGKFDATTLTEAIQKVITDQRFAEGELLKDAEADCKVFVCATKEENSAPVLLRTYKNPTKAPILFDECKIWEACRATSAADMFFDAIEIGRYKQKFHDGGINHNNPVQLVHREAMEVWGAERRLIIVSIGTGAAPAKAFRGNVKKIVESMTAMLTQTERTANDFLLSQPEMRRDKRYFRFNVLSGLGEIGLEEYKEIGAIATATESYIDHGETGEKSEQCVRRLLGKPLQEWESEKEKPVPFIVPFSRDDQFVGRESVLRQIQTRLSDASLHRRVALTGIGGAGKTQIAAEYAYRLAESVPKTSIFWVYAGNQERFKESLIRIADILGLSSQTKTVHDKLCLVQTFLSSAEAGPWLIVLDNADDADVLFTVEEESGFPLIRYLPQRSDSSILVTTRNKKAGCDLTMQNESIEVSGMSLEEARHLMKTKLHQDLQTHDMDTLLMALEYLPLVISQATAFMSRYTVDTTGFLDIFQKEPREFLSEDYRDLRSYDGKSNAAYVSWSLSFKQIELKEPAAAELLSLMSFYDRQGIPKYLLYRPEESALAFQKAIGVLLGFSLIFSSKSADTYGMHRLVRLAMRHWLENNGNQNAVVGVALRSLSNAFPNGLPETHERCTALMPHAQLLVQERSCSDGENSISRAEVLCKTSSYLWRVGQFGTAKKGFEEAISIYELKYGNADLRTLSALNGLGLVLHSMGADRTEVENLHRRILKSYESILDPEHPRILTSRNNLALCICGMSEEKNREAEVLQRSVIGAREKTKDTYGPADYWTSNQVLAAILNAGKRYEAAEAVARRTLAGRESFLSSTYPAVFTTLTTLAESLLGQKKFSEAEAFARRAALGRYNSPSVGKNHSQTRHSLRILNNALRAQGKGEFDVIADAGL